MKTTQRYCHTCNAARPFHKNTTNHLLHLLLSLVTLGVWIPVWIVIAFSSPFRRYRCGRCGEARL